MHGSPIASLIICEIPQRKEAIENRMVVETNTRVSPNA
jgi:hypothetical protein